MSMSEQSRPEPVSRYAGRILGTHDVAADERAKVIAAIEALDVFATVDDLPADVRGLLDDIAARPTSDDRLNAG